MPQVKRLATGRHRVERFLGLACRTRHGNGHDKALPSILIIGRNIGNQAERYLEMSLGINRSLSRSYGQLRLLPAHHHPAASTCHSVLHLTSSHGCTCIIQGRTFQRHTVTQGIGHFQWFQLHFKHRTLIFLHAARRASVVPLDAHHARHTRLRQGDLRTERTHVVGRHSLLGQRVAVGIGHSQFHLPAFAHGKLVLAAGKHETTYLDGLPRTIHGTVGIYIGNGHRIGHGIAVCSASQRVRPAIIRLRGTKIVLPIIPTEVHRSVAPALFFGKRHIDRLAVTAVFLHPLHFCSCHGVAGEIVKHEHLPTPIGQTTRHRAHITVVQLQFAGLFASLHLHHIMPRTRQWIQRQHGVSHFIRHICRESEGLRLQDLAG